MYANYGTPKIDYSAPLMMMILKIISVSLNYYDGQLPIEELNKASSKYVFKNLPTPLEYFSFCFFFPCLFAGTYIINIKRTCF
jgi:hypothetical protein